MKKNLKIALCGWLGLYDTKSFVHRNRAVKENAWSQISPGSKFHTKSGA